MPSPDEIVRSMCEGRNASDPDQISQYFAEAGVHHNIPLKPALGRVATRDGVAGFLASLDASTAISTTRSWPATWS